MHSSQTVHALLYGQPLCGFSDTVPANWPEGHVWTYVADIKNITCASCKARAQDTETKRAVPTSPASSTKKKR